MVTIKSNVENFKDYMSVHIESFLLSKKKGAKNTENNYRVQLRLLFKDIYGYDTFDFITKEDIEKLTLKVLNDYFDAMYEEVDDEDKRVHSNSKINLRMSAIKQLLKYLTSWDIISYPIYKLDELLKTLPNEQVRIKAIPLDVAEKMFDYFKNVDTTDTHYQKYILIKLLADLGVRTSAVLSLRWENFTVDGDWVIVQSTNESKDKSGHWHDKISKEFYEEILQLKREGDDRLFTIAYRTMASAMKVANRFLNFPENEFSAHSFKKLAVTSAYRNSSNDLISAMKKGRHKNPQTTMRYIEAIDYGLTGIISSGGNNLDKELYKKVSHEELLKALEDIDSTTLHLINSKLNENLNKK